MIEKDLYDKICDDVEARREWADRQPHWYHLRIKGMGRKYKPYPHCSDKRFPLIDMGISKKKPVFINQLFAQERLADFFPADPRDQEDVLAISWWFDYKLKHKSNLEEELDLITDYMCVYGRGVLKAFWNPDEKQLQFEAIEPVFIVVPDGCRDIQISPYIVHIMHLSVWDYKHGVMSKNYKQDEDFIERITGGEKDSEFSEESDLIDTKKRQEGINYTKEKNTIIVWEIYERQDKGTYIVHTISPSIWDEPIREDFEYNVRDNHQAPFIDFPMERIGRSFYSSRGMAETGAEFQSYITSTWNGKGDAMQQWNNPPLSAQKDVPNTTNLRTGIPGTIIPFPVVAVNPGPPPISWDLEMSNTRDIAEQVWAIPDFALGEQPFGQDKKGGSKQTATEVNFKQGWTNQVVDYQSKVFRRSLSKLWNFTWDLCYENDKDMRYLHSKEYKELAPQVKDKVESLGPSGSSQSWDISRRYQKAVQRFMMFNQDPYINQVNLRKSILELDEPGLVELLIIDPKEEEKRQYEEAMKEVPALDIGMPLTPKPTDDHAAHWRVECQYLTKKTRDGVQGDPMAAKCHMNHMNAHMKELMKINPKLGNQMMAELKAEVQKIQQEKEIQQEQAMEPQLQL